MHLPLLLALAAAPTAGDEPGRAAALVAAVVPAGADVSPRFADKLTELLRAELGALGLSVAPAAEVERLRAGTREDRLPDLVPARAALEDGKNLYLNLDFGRAIERLDEARKGFEEALAQADAFDPLAEALAFLGASHLGLRQVEGAQAAYRAILRLRPGYALDQGLFPPEAAEAFAAARRKQDPSPRGWLSVASAPPLAAVFLDGERRGETPLRLGGLAVGRHFLRVEAEGFRPFAGAVDVAAEGTEREITLVPSLAGDELRRLEADAASGGTRAAMVARARALARSAGVRLVVFGAVAKSGEGFVLSAARVADDGSAHQAWTAVDAQLLRAAHAVRALARSLVAVAGPAFIEAGAAAPVALPDFNHSFLGLRPPEPFLAAPPPAPAAPPIYGRWWFWVGLVAVGAAGAVGYLYLRPPAVVRAPDVVGIDVEVRQ